MDLNVDKVIGCSEDTKNYSKFNNSFILVNNPAVERSLVYTDAKINSSYYKDISQIEDGAPLFIKINTQGGIEYVKDSKGTKYPSVISDEVQSTNDSFVIKLENGSIVRLLKVKVYDDKVDVPDSVSDSIINSLTIIRSYWDNF